MAVTAKFVADFSSFNDAVEKAEVKLTEFAKDANKVESALKRMSDSLVGRKVVQEAALMAKSVEAIGGVSKLTASNLARVAATASEAVDQLTRLGKDVPEGLAKLARESNALVESQARLKKESEAAAAAQVKLARDAGAAEKASGGFGAKLSTLNGLLATFGVGLSVGALVSFGRSVLAAGDSIQKMSDQTGIGTEEIQRLQYIAGQSGSSMESLVSAIQNLQQRLGENNSGTVGAIRKLNINLEQFRQLDSYQQMLTLAESIRSIQDPTEQAALAADVFGKNWKEILPAIKSGMRELGEEADVMSDKAVKATDRFGDALDALLQKSKNIAAEAFAAVGEGLTQNLEETAASDLERVADAAARAAEKQAAAMKRAEDGAKKYRSQGIEPLRDVIAPTGFELRELNEQLDKNREAMNRSAEAAKKAAEEQRKFGEIVTYVTQRSEGLAAAFETIDGFVAEGIRYYAARGVALERLVKMYGLTTLQAEAMESRLRIESLMAEAAAKSYGKLATEVYNVATAQGTLTARPLPHLPKLQAGSNPAITAATSGDSWSNLFDGVPEIMAQAMAASGKIENALRAAMAKIGAQIGKMIGSVFGELGGKIGEQVGSMIGYVAEKMWDAFTTSSGEDVARRIGQNWGIRITEAMGDQIAKDAAEMFNGSRQAAELWNMRDIFAKDPNNLGITQRNVDQATARLHDVFSMIETGQMTVAQGAKVIDENWSDLVEAGTDAFGFVSAEMRELIDLNGRFGTQSKEIAKFLKDQADAAVKASNAVIASIRPMVEGWKKLREQGVDTTLVARAHKQELEDLGVVALSTFAAAIAAGKSFAEAMEAAGPGLSQLTEGFEALGISTDNAALKALMLQSTILQKNPALVQGVSALGSAFAALSNMGVLNTDTFKSMTQTGMQMYQRLQAEVAAVGGTTRDALLPMQDYLHKAQRAAEELGIPLDENTQMLIDQSKELGIWKEAGKTATDKMVDGFERLINKLDEFINRLAGIPNPEVRGRVTWDVDPIPQKPGGLGDDAFRLLGGVREMAEGGVGTVTKPTLFLAGEAGPEQFAFSGANRTFGSGGGTGTTEVHLHIGDRELGSFVLEDISAGGKNFGKFRALVRAVA
jgi:hypothetical protein